MKVKTSPSFLLALTILISLNLSTPASWAQNKYYRYTNNEGVKVINSFVPAEYVKNGYEIVTLSGQVLDVIEPAPTPEEAEKLAAQRQKEAQLAEWDQYLLKRYSTVADIEAAKERKLRDFEASVSILRGNATNIRGQIEQVQARAASTEREGRKVPESTINSLRALELELEDTERQLTLREADKLEIADKYDADIERFQIIKAKSE
jgi:hypothetical protein